MNAWDITYLVIGLLLVIWLLKSTIEWYAQGKVALVCSRPESHWRRMAELQEQTHEAQLQLDYYLSTPNWFDLEWPICDDLDVSSDGEYCTHCYRMVTDHAARVAT